MSVFEYFSVRSRPEIFYYNTRPEYKPRALAIKLAEMIREEMKGGKKGIVFLCIGTDRSTGDSLGPLVGYKLLERGLKGKAFRQAAVFGTLDRPVHAMNLEQYHAFVLKPGLGVSKNLSEVGDIFITGIVGGCTSFDPVMLQSIRLSVVMHLADCICESIGLVENLWDFPPVI